MKKKKVIFYGVKDFPSRGGTSRVVENIILNLLTEFEVTLYCYKNEKAQTNIAGIKVLQFPVFPLKEVGVFIYYFITALHILFFQNAKSIIHAHKTDCAIFIPLLRLKHKVILTSHEAPYKRDKWGKSGKLYFRFMEKVFIYSGATLTSISKPLSDYYENRYKKKVKFIPNGITLNEEYDYVRAENILTKERINGPFITFAARRLMATKGCHTMLEALSLINYTNPIVIAGELDHAGNYVNELKKKYGHLNIYFIGYIEPLSLLLGLIKKSDLFIFPSETEGMSIMFLEVISTGVNIIASDIPENTQILDSDEILYFKNKDAHDLADKISFALTNKEILNEYNKKALKKIKEKFLWDQIAKEYIKAYNALLN